MWPSVHPAAPGRGVQVRECRCPSEEKWYESVRMQVGGNPGRQQVASRQVVHVRGTGRWCSRCTGGETQAEVAGPSQVAGRHPRHQVQAEVVQ